MTGLLEKRRGDYSDSSASQSKAETTETLDTGVDCLGANQVPTHDLWKEHASRRERGDVFQQIAAASQAPAVVTIRIALMIWVL
jgi:hypothetical protein